MAASLIPTPSQPPDVPWPTATWPFGQLPRTEATARAASVVEHLVDEVGTSPDGPVPGSVGRTFALLVVQDGRLVVERYGERHVDDLEALAGKLAGRLDAEEPFPSWSIAKSILHAVLGILVRDGKVAIDERVPVPEWQDPADPRHSITWRHLLEMRAGLEWVEKYYDFSDGEVPDVVRMLFGEGHHDVAAYAAAKPLVAEPGTPEAYCYSSGTTNILARCVQQVVGGKPRRFERFVRHELFRPLGMSSARLTFDEAGTWVASSYVHATARDYARFGLLYLRDGVWGDRRLLPEGWVEGARQPRSPDEDVFHSMHWWVHDDALGTFMADGFEGQRILVVPSADMVVVRLGRTHGDGTQELDRRLHELVTALAE